MLATGDAICLKRGVLSCSNMTYIDDYHMTGDAMHGSIQLLKTLISILCKVVRCMLGVYMCLLAIDNVIVIIHLKYIYILDYKVTTK